MYQIQSCNQSIFFHSFHCSLLNALRSYVEEKWFLAKKKTHKRVLFIGDDIDWYSQIADLLGLRKYEWRNYLPDKMKSIPQKDLKTAIVIIDISSLQDTATANIASSMKRLCPTILQIFTSELPTWRMARDALMHGATDYIEKDYDTTQYFVARLKQYLQIQDRSGRNR